MTKARRLLSVKANTNPFEGGVGLVYARVSTKTQEKDGHGLESQEGRCIQDLLSIGVQHEKTFRDSYTGGGDFMERPAMREMLAYVDANPHKKFVAVFDDLKRFARDTVFHLKLRSALKARDIIPRCLNYNFDDSPEGMFVETVLAAGNELERHQNLRQVIQKMKARLEAGYWPFGGKKGYTCHIDPLHGKLFRPNDEGKILADAIHLFISRDLQRKVDVCRFLVEKGFWKKQSPDKYIDKLDAIMREPFYYGHIEYERWGVARRTGRHEGIISAEDFECLQRLLKRGDTVRRIRRNISPDFPLRGLVTCDHCGSPLTAGWSKKVFPYYVCHGKNCPRYGKSIRRNEIETQFADVLQQNSLKTEIDTLVTIVFDRVWAQEIDNCRIAEQSIAIERTKLQQKASQLSDAIFGAKMLEVKDVYEKQLEQVAMRLAEINVPSITARSTSIPYRTALTKAIALLKNPYSIWCNLDVHEQHRLFFFIFDSKLAYNQETGYRTEKSPNAVRLFEDFAGVSTRHVDIEPATLNRLVSSVFEWYHFFSAPENQNLLLENGA